MQIQNSALHRKAEGLPDSCVYTCEMLLDVSRFVKHVAYVSYYGLVQ